ncbi:efflux RND transporter periplasmic adaptor subunit [Aquimonas voraii]|uniref:Membrane fusion protein, cobalt-zinc-cadmium efflux system n=1 Tax=Aquimonas voraii TaxID=265719 RepID=A0A1G6VET9_9GAMM|nr:efflux RND transporter periplasmic adaptor subunit [Aquimonas voraii]SDD52034.1 membrane fusion protein, cobalt-zinc-cadmium efflux system [Aquimonas voraii]
MIRPARNTLLLVLLTLGLAACGEHAHDDDHGHGHDDHGHGHDDHADEAPKGPHGGRLHEDAGLEVELKIEEDGQPPRYAAWVRLDGQPVAPANAQVSVQLERLGGQVDTHTLRPQNDRLVGSGVVGEPHSFVVTVRAEAAGRRAEWRYESFEGRTRIAQSAADEIGIRVEPIGSGPIEQRLRAQGRVVLPANAQAAVSARFPGLIRSLRADIGERVGAGQLLAEIESNASLGRYTVASPIDGVVLERAAALGGMAGDAPLFVIGRLDALVADLPVFGAEALALAPGTPVRLTRLIDGRAIDSALQAVLPQADAHSQSLVARVALPVDDGQWRPGMAVEASLQLSADEVPLRLPLSALQRFRDWQVAFLRVGEDYEIRPLELGRSDGDWVEVLEGLKAGDEVVVEQSFLIKADIEKSGASHDH